MDFSRIARQLNEGESVDAAAAASERAKESSVTTKDDNNDHLMTTKTTAAMPQWKQGRAASPSAAPLPRAWWG